MGTDKCFRRSLVYRSDKALNEAMRYFIQLLTEQKEDLK